MPAGVASALAGSHLDDWNRAVALEVWRLREAAWADAEAVFERGRSMLEREAAPDVGFLLTKYVEGVGSFADPTYAGLRRMTTQIGRMSGLLSADGDFFDPHWAVKAEIVESYCPQLREDLFCERSNSDLSATLILESSPNEIRDLRLPEHVSNLTRKARRAPFWMYTTDDALAYVHPYQYQILARDQRSLWVSGSPRRLRKSHISRVRRVSTDRNIVVVQDRFDFRNFCHFLCDGLTRVLHYAQYQGIARDDLFVFGAIPDEYHRLIFAALARLIGIGSDNLLFPREGLVLDTSKRCFWFSDQVHSYVHPAQMAHPTSVGLLRSLTREIPHYGSSAKRIYISRADAARRRIVNESALFDALRGFGFEQVVLANLSAKEQVGLFQNVEIVVAPHGMGLTHILMGRRIERLIELFHPENGTEAYAFLARTMGLAYDYVLGEQVPDRPDDFSVSVEQVIQLLGIESVSRRRPVWTKAANLIPCSASFKGFSSVDSDDSHALPPRLIWDQEVRSHTQADASHDANFGVWRGIAVAPGIEYTVSCWVWIDDDSHGSKVFIELGNWLGQAQRSAEPFAKRVWQRIATTARAPGDIETCWTGLFIKGGTGSIVYSTCWQFERGSEPNAYVSTD